MPIVTICLVCLGSCLWAQRPAGEPCDAYYGFPPYPPAAAVSYWQGSQPGLFYFYHIPDPDTNVTLVSAEWWFVHDTSMVLSYPGDTISHQFPSNGNQEVYIYADYLTPLVGHCEHSNNFFVTVTGMPVAADEPSLHEAQWTVFPNPFSSVLHIQDLPTVSGRLQIFDLQGQLQRSISQNGASTLEVEASQLSDGAYILRYSNRQGESHRLIVKH